MKSIAKIICCGVALAWMYSATAEEEAADTTSAAEGQVTETTSAAAGAGSALPVGGGAAPAAAAADDVVVPTPPAPRIAVKPYHDKVNRANVEKRIEDNAVRTRKRSAEAEKDVAERAAKTAAMANNSNELGEIYDVEMDNSDGPGTYGYPRERRGNAGAEDTEGDGELRHRGEYCKKLQEGRCRVRHGRF